MIVTGWNNGDWRPTGAGYGVKLRKQDRDKHFEKKWASVLVTIDGRDAVKIKLSKSFWKNCVELRSREIGAWMKTHGFSIWPAYKPPQFKLILRGRQAFELSLTTK
jgi:hypothetical protein